MAYMTKKIAYIILSAILLTLNPLRTAAQFITSGEDPARLHWKQAKFPDFRVVYPEGLDSLARVYGNLLEKYRLPVSRSTGLEAGAGYRNRTPVVLHAYNGVSNAMVAWSPKRMEFYTLAMPYETEALSWEKNLAIHEGRHLSQMMLGYTGMYKPLHWITGDALPIAVSGAFSPQFLLEGDAVVAETALTEIGRGRDGDFLNYYHSAFDRDILRNWSAWKYGSWRHYAPNHYALGYLTIAGTRVFYDDPLFMDNIYSSIYRFRFFGNYTNNIRREIKRASGMKFKEAWNGIVEGFQNNWEESARLRGPFINSEFATEVPSWYEEYDHGTFVQDDYYVVRCGLVRPTVLSRIEDDGSVTDIRPFSGSTSDLYFDENLGRLYWSETFTHPRWTHEATSRIRYIDLSELDTDKRKIRSKGFKPQTLTKKGRLYNPAASGDGKLVAAVDYRYEGGTDLVVLDAFSGEIRKRFHAPDGLQLTLPSWYGDDIAVVGLSDDGMGIYKLSDGSFTEIVAPVKAKIGGLRTTDSGLVFSSDRSGVNEIYEYRDGEVFQRTATRYGAADGIFNRDTLYFLSQETGIQLYRKNGQPRGKKHYGEGTLVHKAAVGDLIDRKVDFQTVAVDKVADALSRQEMALAEGTMVLDEDFEPEIKKYNKLVHIPRFHSWAPLSVQYSNFSELNFDEMMEAAGVGATAWFQNDLGTSYGYVSYGYNLAPVRKEGVWMNRHSGHFDLIYSGLYPVFEIEAHVGERPAYNYYRTKESLGDLNLYTLGARYSDRPSVALKLRAYLPLTFNSGGWRRGVTPSIQYRYSNDLYRKDPAVFDYSSGLEGDFASHREFVGIESTSSVLMQSLSASVTGYIMQSNPAALMYPKLGVGAQLGYHQRLGLGDIYSAGVYGYFYGYLPGFGKAHGMKLTAAMQHTFNAFYTENVLDLQPRGFKTSDLGSILAGAAGNQFKATADYALQFALPDKQWFSEIAHFSHMSMVPHFDISLFPYYATNDLIRPGMLYTAGIDICAHMENAAWFPVSGYIGLSINYNGGPSMDRLMKDGCELPQTYVGLLYKLDI